jgi:hypothetical protein
LVVVERVNLSMLSSWIEERRNEWTTKRSLPGLDTMAWVLEIAAGLIRRLGVRPFRRIVVSRVSEEWLRAHAKESSKHCGGS